MAKMRGIKPEFWTDEKMVDLSIPARLLFIGMWNYACDNGHIEDRPKQIKMRILPADDVSIEELLNEMVAVGCLLRGDGYMTIPALPEHQRLDRRYLAICERCDPSDPAQPVVDTTGARSAHAVDTRAAHVEGRKEGEEKKELAHAVRTPGRARQLPDDWQPNQGHRNYADDNRLTLDSEADQFRDHHRAKGSTMKDWDAAFRTWLRNAVKWRTNAPGAKAATDDSWMRMR